MATFPGASVQLLAQTGQQPRIRPTIVILHTHVGPRGGGHVHPGKSLEWHFDVAVGGAVRQWVSTDVRADANWRANSFTRNGERLGAISIETGDQHFDGDPGLARSWSDLGQFDALVELVTWCCRTHGIPAQECSAWDGAGIGYHSMWGINERGAGDGRFGRYEVPESMGGGTARLNNPWTTALGKTCPGPGKIAEFPAVLAAVQARLGGEPAPALTSTPVSTPVPEHAGPATRTTTVLRGEGWVQVAERVLRDGRRFVELQALNGGDRMLHPGDVLLVPT
jgi:hypothetical protein